MCLLGCACFLSRFHVSLVPGKQKNKQQQQQQRSASTHVAAPPSKKAKIQCDYCKKFGHTADVCRKKIADSAPKGLFVLSALFSFFSAHLRSRWETFVTRHREGVEAAPSWEWHVADSYGQRRLV